MIQNGGAMFALSLSHLIMATLSPELQAAYEATQFVVDGTHVIRMREAIPEALASWLRSHNTTVGAILGAEYPFSQPTSAEENDRRHALLIDECTQRAIPWLPAMGVGDDWQERHIMVAGIDRASAEDFRARYEQHAVVIVEVGELPMLVVGGED